jgi:hypothetical protein
MNRIGDGRFGSPVRGRCNRRPSAFFTERNDPDSDSGGPRRNKRCFAPFFKSVDRRHVAGRKRLVGKGAVPCHPLARSGSRSLIAPWGAIGSQHLKRCGAWRVRAWKGSAFSRSPRPRCEAWRRTTATPWTRSNESGYSVSHMLPEGHCWRQAEPKGLGSLHKIFA